ncbi:MAG: CARDB domain-containing protein [Candidatus Thorarchaeota archaeon]
MMKRKITVALFLVAFLAIPAVVATGVNNGFTPAQDPETIISIFDEGAEALFTYVDNQGRPVVAYAQVGLPGAELEIDTPKYDNCIAMAVLQTRGDLLEYVLGTVGANLFNMSDSGTGSPDDGGLFSVNQILGYLGTEFGVLATAYLNIDATTAQQRMGAVVSNLQAAPFNFDFVDLIAIRLDEAFFAQLNFTGTLPFESLDIFFYQILSEPADVIAAVLDPLDDSGLLDAIDETKFTDEDISGSAAALIVIPNLDEILNMFGGDFLGGTITNPTDYMLAQTTNFGPMAIAAAAYVGDQTVEAGDTEISLAEIVGASTVFDPFNNRHSVVIAGLADAANVTGITPDDSGLAFMEGNMIFWNASGLHDLPAYTSGIPDFVIEFESDDFPPMVTVTRTFNPESVTPGNTVAVRVTVENDGDDPITNVTINDSAFLDRYSTLVVAGTFQTSVTSIAPGGNTYIEYTVTFQNEGAYAFTDGVVTYDYNGNSFEKPITDEAYLVSTDITGVLLSLVQDGWPYSGMLLGLVGLGAIFNLARARGGKSGSMYQV